MYYDQPVKIQQKAIISNNNQKIKTPPPKKKKQKTKTKPGGAVAEIWQREVEVYAH